MGLLYDWHDIKHFAESTDIPLEAEDAAAKAAGFESVYTISPYLRLLIQMHYAIPWQTPFGKALQRFFNSGSHVTPSSRVFRNALDFTLLNFPAASLRGSPQ